MGAAGAFRHAQHNEWLNDALHVDTWNNVIDVLLTLKVIGGKLERTGSGKGWKLIIGSGEYGNLAVGEVTANSGATTLEFTQGAGGYTLSGNIHCNPADVSWVLEIIQGVADDLEELTRRVEKLETDFSTIESNVNSNLSSMWNDISGVKGSITEIEKANTEQDHRMDRFQSDLASQAGSLGGVESMVADLERRVTALEGGGV